MSTDIFYSAVKGGGRYNLVYGGFGVKKQTFQCAMYYVKIHFTRNRLHARARARAHVIGRLVWFVVCAAILDEYARRYYDLRVRLP